MTKFFTEGKALSPKEVVAKLCATGTSGDVVSAQTGASLDFLHDCRLHGLSPAGLLARFVDPQHKDLKDMYGAQAANIDNGISATFAAAGVPLHRNTELDSAILAAASDTFTTGGLRILLPLLMDNLVREVDNTVQVERVEDLVSQTRQVAGNTVITEIIYDKNTPDAYDSFRIPELGKIPVRTLKGTRNQTEFYKIGSGIEFSYEAARRISPDMMTPMIARQKFERTQAEATLAAQVLLNGDGYRPAAPVVTLQTYDGQATGSIENRARGVMKFLLDCAKKRRPVDTMVVNWETAFSLMVMFPINNAQNVESRSISEIGQRFNMNFSMAGFPNLGIRIVISSMIPDNSALVYRRPETLERLLEIGSEISEMEQAIRNQSVVMVNTINVGFAMTYHESRQLLTWTP